MEIHDVAIEDYRGIKSLHLDFDREITVILGRNGVGKSTILDAVALLLQTIQTAWPSNDGAPQWRVPQFSHQDRRFGCDDSLIELGFSFQTSTGNSESNIPAPTTFSFRYSDSVKNVGSLSFQHLWNFMNNGGLNNEGRPLMVYYRQDRGFDVQTPAFQTSADPTIFSEVVQTSLQGSLRAISQLQSWWDKRDAEEGRRVRDYDSNYRDPQLEAVRKLIKEIDGFSGITYSSTRNPEGLYFEKAPGTFIHVSLLSSGERSFIILLADLARRLQIIQPDAKLSEIRGIVLIDEIELNLHPGWQSKIISTLRRVFTRCQFVITTHSPQVVSSVESNHVRILSIAADGTHKVDVPTRTKGQTSNFLLEGVFGSNERFPEIGELMSRFNDAVDREDLLLASDLYQEITSEIEGNPPELLVLKKRLAKLRGN